MADGREERLRAPMHRCCDGVMVILDPHGMSVSVLRKREKSSPCELIWSLA